MTTLKSPYSRAYRWGLGWFPFWLWSYTIVEGSILRPEKIPHIFLRANDKFLHHAAYFLLFLATYNAFRLSLHSWIRHFAERKSYFYCVLMGAATEIAQLYVPGRTADIKDWIADALGALLGFLVIELFMRRKLVPREVP